MGAPWVFLPALIALIVTAIVGFAVWRVAASLSIASARGLGPIDFVEYVDGIENPAEAFPNIVRWLVAHGYSDDDIARAIGGNVMRVLEEVWWR